jgi:nitric oxide reductase subunit C
MLSKSQAKAFFLGGTGVFSAAFIALSVDSMRQVPALTHDDQITDSVARGKHLWEANNCMGCHTLFGEGAYYAPELTLVVQRRGKPWINLFLDDPEKMFPGARKMVKYGFNQQQKDDLIAFLEWCGNVNLQGFPPKPPLRNLVAPASTANTTASNQPELFRTICIACHAIGGIGANVGPALDDVYKRKNREELIAWISDPQKLKPGTPMPQIPMSPEQLKEIVDYLLGLANAPAPTRPIPAQPAAKPEDFE